MNDDTKIFIIGLIFGICIGIVSVTLLNILSNESILKDHTLIKNESNDWYWLQSKEYTQTQLNELYKLKQILINNECIDGGFIENINGEEFAIVCYQAISILKEEQWQD